MFSKWRNVSFRKSVFMIFIIKCIFYYFFFMLARFIFLDLFSKLYKFYLLFISKRNILSQEMLNKFDKISNK